MFSFFFVSFSYLKIETVIKCLYLKDQTSNNTQTNQLRKIVILLLHAPRTHGLDYVYVCSLDFLELGVEGTFVSALLKDIFRPLFCNVSLIICSNLDMAQSSRDSTPDVSPPHLGLAVVDDILAVMDQEEGEISNDNLSEIRLVTVVLSSTKYD